MAEITGTTMSHLVAVHKQNNLEIDIVPVVEQDEKKSSPNTPNIIKNKCSCPPWLYDLRTSYAGGVLVWIALIGMAYMMLSKLGDEDDTYNNNNGNNATTTSCDDDDETLLLFQEGLATHFFDESCVAALTCDDQAMLALFMYQFLLPLRVEMVLFNQVYLLISFMVVQQGGIPSTTKDDDEKSRWYLGCFAWTAWVACVALQWVTTASSAISLVFSYISMEAEFRPCMVELGSGDALLNTTLPGMLFHPVLLSLLMNMLSLVHAIIMALRVAGVELDTSRWLLRYAVAVLGPYFTFGVAYYFATLSFVFGKSLVGCDGDLHAGSVDCLS